MEIGRDVYIGITMNRSNNLFYNLPNFLIFLCSYLFLDCLMTLPLHLLPSFCLPCIATLLMETPVAKGCMWVSGQALGITH